MYNIFSEMINISMILSIEFQQHTFNTFLERIMINLYTILNFVLTSSDSSTFLMYLPATEKGSIAAQRKRNAPTRRQIEAASCSLFLLFISNKFGFGKSKYSRKSLKKDKKTMLTSRNTLGNTSTAIRFLIPTITRILHSNWRTTETTWEELGLTKCMIAYDFPNISLLIYFCLVSQRDRLYKECLFFI